MNSGHQRGNELVISERHTSAIQPIGGSGGTTSRGAGSLYEGREMLRWNMALLSRPSARGISDGSMIWQRG